MSDGFEYDNADAWGANRPCNWCSMQRLARTHPNLTLSAPHGDNVTAYVGGRVAAVYMRLPARCACDDGEFVRPEPDDGGDKWPDAVETTATPWQPTSRAIAAALVPDGEDQ